MSRVRVSPGYIRRPGPLVAVSLAYLVLVSGVMIWRGISVSPDYLLLILVPVALLSGRFLRFLRDWVPFIALFLGYEALRDLVPKSHIAVHYELPIRGDEFMFGGADPSEWLQAHLGSLRWLAIACTVVYFCHFIVPVAVGMVLWLVDRVQFLRFVVALLAMCFAAFVVFLLFPVAPPWLAGQQGLLPGVHSLISLPSAVSPYYNMLNPDPTAAFPSLHAAFPLLSALALWPVTRRGAALALAWSAVVWFSVVYLGQHYVTDVIGGIAFAVGTWVIVTRFAAPLVPALRRQFGALAAAGTVTPGLPAPPGERHGEPHGLVPVAVAGDAPGPGERVGQPQAVPAIRPGVAQHRLAGAVVGDLDPGDAVGDRDPQPCRGLGVHDGVRHQLIVVSAPSLPLPRCRALRPALAIRHSRYGTVATRVRRAKPAVAPGPAAVRAR
jgi:membrane-associated phospholipid phosphatase